MVECPGSLWLVNIITMLPPTIVALGGFITALRLRHPVLHTEQRAEQLFNGEFARGERAGRREAAEQAGEFTQS